MDEHKWLAERFEANRTHLRAVAYREGLEPRDAVGRRDPRLPIAAGTRRSRSRYGLRRAKINTSM